MTLRQLYYQFVARDLIENSQRSYKRLGKVISNARMAGLIDWEAIVDRTRNLRTNPHWSSVSSVLNAAANSYRLNLWEAQQCAVEVWIEKEALRQGLVLTVYLITSISLLNLFILRARW